MDDSHNHSFVFQDTRGKRWPRLRRGLLLGGIVLFLGLVVFVQSLFVKPQFRLPPAVRNLKGQLKALQETQKPRMTDHAATWLKFRLSQASQDRLEKLHEFNHPRPAKNISEIRLGFYANFDDDAYNDLEAHGNLLTHLSEESMTVMDGAGRLNIEEDPRVVKLAAAKGVTLMPLLNNILADKWLPEAVENLANGPDAVRRSFIAALIAHLDSIKAGGVVIDWEQIDPTYRKSLSDFLIEIADELHKTDRELWLEVPMGDDFKTFDLDRLADSVDRFVAALCDENSEIDPPGPLASQSWFEGWLKVLPDYGEAGQWIGVIGARGYDWTEGKPKAETISFPDAMSRAAYAGVKGVSIQAPNYNPGYSYQEPEGKHTVWFLDAITFLNQLRAVRGAKLGGVAVDRLGSEDPRIWDVLTLDNINALSKSAAVNLEKLTTADTVTNVGQGEMVTVDLASKDGMRMLGPETEGHATVTYDDFPIYPILYHEGGGKENEVTLTFDDGPDPKWTPQVLDILKQRGIKATFFLVGLNAESYPGLVRRIVEEGHEIGNHTYTHANLATMSDVQIELELNATQLLIESITGRSTALCRPPYAADSRPTSLAELRPLSILQDKLGYLIVMENIDPEDWARPGTDVIVQRVKDLRARGNIILLHDAGGNRSQTVAALPRIIDFLQARGDDIISLSDLLDMKRDDVMPPVRKGERGMTRFVSGAGFRILHDVEIFSWAFMIAATALIVVRTILVGILAYRHHGRSAPAGEAPYAPPLSILIAAYNEEKVIKATLRSVVDTDYPGPFEVIVVDDGSTDQTAAEVAKAAFVDKRIRLVKQRNGGKAAALQTAVLEAKHDIFVFLDADTHFERTTLARLVRPLRGENAGAVSGHARVGNLRTFIARCQSLEYVCGFNLDRRAYAEWDCITVVPGAISALKRSALAAAGGFSLDTLAEDTDLTLSLHRNGYKIDYVADAVAWTEAPETIRGLARQRFRWAYGTLQCLWKHRDLVFNTQFKALGWFSLPSVWFFQIILVAITPVVDNLLIISLLFGWGGVMWYYFVTFLGMDLLLAMIACHLDGVKLRNALTIVPMRLLYRPLLSWVIWRAIFRATKGAFVTWGKLERTASLPMQAS